MIDAELLIGLRDALMLLPYLSQRCKFLGHLAAQTVSSRLGVSKNTLSESLMSSQELSNIIFDGELRMKLRPVMSGTHEGQQEIQLLHIGCTKCAF